VDTNYQGKISIMPMQPLPGSSGTVAMHPANTQANKLTESCSHDLNETCIALLPADWLLRSDEAVT
jgi:hypothetical protein